MTPLVRALVVAAAVLRRLTGRWPTSSWWVAAGPPVVLLTLMVLGVRPW